jgi:pimeloyl-ACP methyl ester carboxylesterase
MTQWLQVARPDGLPVIAYRAEGSGPPLVLVHGVGGDSGNWDDIVPRLAPRFRVVRPDLRGHGRSGRITASCRLEDFAGDVTSVMDAAGISRCRLVGFSLGGLIAQQIALDAPGRVEKLVLISAVAGRTQAERAKVQGRLEVLAAQGIGAVAAGSQERWFTGDFQKAYPEKVTERMSQLLANDPVSYLHAYTVFGTADLADRLAGIQAGTLIVTGEHDTGSSPRMAALMHERIQGSQLRILPGLRHSVLIESPDLIADLLDGFL